MQREKWRNPSNVSQNQEENSPRWRAELFAPVFKEITQSLPEVMEIHSQNRRTRLLVTMVPDELVKSDNLVNKDPRTFIGIVLLVDVSGLTMLCEMFKHAGQGGSISLNATLNAYFGYIVQAVYFYGGDVIKITVTGLLAIWSVPKDQLIFNILHEVITCGLRIQEAVGNFQTVVNVILKLRLTISAGNLSFMVIGANGRYHYLVAGPPLEEARLAKKVCHPGDLVLAGSAWGHCNPSTYEYVIKDTYNVKIQSLKTAARQATKKTSVPGKSDRSTKKKLFTVDENLSLYWERIDPYNDLIIAARSAITEVVLRKIDKQIRTFVVESVLRLTDTEQPLEYLTEFCQVTAMYVNVIPMKCSVQDLLKLVDDIFVQLVGMIKDRGGCVIGTWLFHKDISFLTVFGLEKNSNESVSKTALQTGVEVRNILKNFYGVQKVSVSVTTGMAHCGIVGHTLRREYMVIGSPLQKAVELGTTCIGKVTCDLTTLLRSDLPWERFIQQDSRMVKDVGFSVIYEYIDDVTNFAKADPELFTRYPILGRKVELNILSLSLDDIGLANRKHAGILVKGQIGIGKSRLLDGFVTLIRSRDIVTVTLTLTPEYAIEPYSVIYPILAEILDIDEYCSIQVREQKMVKRLGNVVSLQEFCYLNELMRVRFPISKQCSAESEFERQAQTVKILKGIFATPKVRRCILIDNIQNIDLESWQLLSLVLDVRHILLIASIEIPLDNLVTEAVSAIYADERIAHITLEPIKPQCLTALACQILNVQAIPEFLERQLHSEPHKNPSYCQALLTAALSHGGLQRVEMTPKKATEYKLMFSPVHMLNKIPLGALPEDVAPALPWERRLKIHACLISSYHQFQSSCQNFETNEMLLNTYLKLLPYEQGLLKCAAVLGVTVTRQMLQKMMPNYSNFHTTRAVTSLFNIRILCCASLLIPSVSQTQFCMARKKSTFTDSQHLLYCNCSDTHFGDMYNVQRISGTTYDELPWYSRCRFLAFKMPRFQKLIYDLASDSEKMDYHLKAVQIYKEEAHKCRACGGGSFLDVPVKPKVNKPVAGAKLSNNRRILSHQNDAITGSKESPSLASYRISTQSKTSQYGIENKSTSEGSVANYQAQGERLYSKATLHSFDNRRKVSILPFHVESNDQILASSDSSLDAACGVKYHRRNRGLKCCDWMKNQFSKSAVEPLSETNNDRKFIKIPRLSQFRGIDFRNCQCSLILDNIYKRLLYHSRNTDLGNTTDHIQYLIDYSAGLIQTAQYQHAIKILSKADQLNKINESVSDDVDESITNRIVTKGVILSLISETYFQLGYYEKAHRCTLDEMAIYGYILQTRKTSAYHQLIPNERSQLLREWFPGIPIAKISGKENVDKSRISACICRLSSIFMTNDEPKLAKLTIMASLNISAKCKDQPITELCSYRMAMLYYQQTGDVRFCQRLEKSVLKIIADRYTWADLQSVLIIARVYESIFYAKLIRGELQTAIEYGFKALQIAGRFHSISIRLEIIPILIQAVVQAKRIPEAVDLLQELSYVAQEDVDTSAIIWYYALCLDLILEVGVSVESLEACLEFTNRFLTTNGVNLKNVIRDSDGSKRLLTNIWLLLTRMGMDSEKYELSSDIYLSGIKHNSYSDLWTILKAVECRLLKITYLLKYKRGNTLPDVRKDVVQLFGHLAKASKIAGFVKPRLFLLKAYMDIIRGRMNKANKYVGVALRNAHNQENLLMQASIELHRKAWFDNYSAMNIHWKELANQEECINWRDFSNLSNVDYMSIMYCLPKPENHL